MFLEGYLIMYLIAVVLACAAFSGVVARSKGRSYTAWALGGLLFGPVALIAAAGISDMEAERRHHPEDQGVRT
ncbi:MAG: hypothetical protein AAF865_01455 [Pseudomonadota bacterium]